MNQAWWATRHELQRVLGTKIIIDSMSWDMTTCEFIVDLMVMDCDQPVRQLESAIQRVESSEDWVLTDDYRYIVSFELIHQPSFYLNGILARPPKFNLRIECQLTLVYLPDRRTTGEKVIMEFPE